MQKPSNWDESPTYTGESQALPAGGYVCKILQASETQTKGGRPMLAVLLDIAEGEYAGYFTRQFGNAQQRNPDAKWSPNAIYNQLMDGSSVGFMKGLFTSISESNPGFTCEFDAQGYFDERWLKGKSIGVIFGREQYKSPKCGLRWATKCQAIRSVDTIRKGVEPPADKPYGGGGNDYAPFTDIDDDSLPFN